MKKDKALAISMLRENAEGAGHTYEEICRQTGYERRQVGRLARRIREGATDEELLAHGNSGRAPSTKASESEVRFLRELKGPYPRITIAHFRDIYLEDVIRNPDRADDVERYGLVPRSPSWFRDLFAREGWVSPAARLPGGGTGARPHVVRQPSPRAGELVQVDGCVDGWIPGLGEHAMHLAVDDATTSVLAGWFMPTECTRGYSHMAEEMLRRHGRPLALYSDRASVFRSVRNGAPSQFAAMMSDLGIGMIYAQTGQAKGRVERYNSTAQMRLPVDAVRFGITSYDQLNPWFNDFYAPYLNAKFSFAPRDPRSAFVAMPPGFDYHSVLRGRYTRVVSGGAISYERVTYALVDPDGVVGAIPDRSRVSVFRDALTDELYVERGGMRYECVPVAVQDRDAVDVAGSEKEVDALLRRARRQSFR